MNSTELKQILHLHAEWLRNDNTGKRADLTGASLSKADLSGANLFRANLPYPIYQAQLGQYNIHTNAEYIRIGCCYETIDYWLNVTQTKAEDLGLKKEYYADYMAFIKWYANKYRNNPELFKGESK